MEITQGGWVANVSEKRGGLGFTRMEATYLLFVANGNTQKEIAKALGRHPDTVKHGLDRAYHKLNAYRAAAAVAEAIRRGWIAPLLVALVVGALNPSSEALRVRQPTRTRTQVSASRTVSRRDLGSVYA